MVKLLYLFRHAKSDWHAQYSSDFERPLAARGIAAAAKMGRYLSQAQKIPQHIVCSASVRTRQTLTIGMEEGGWHSHVEFSQTLYLASIRQALAIIHLQNVSIDKLMLVGHEPMCSSLINELTSSYCHKFPTASIAKITFEEISWSDVGICKGSLDWLVSPKDLSE